jgi:CDP-diacylglycerol--glycerol-3-phosphate 3-phosphatidyltransferase
MPLDLPNLVTWLRILLIPLVIGVFYLPDNVISASGKNAFSTAVFIIAALTDWLDGYLARRLGQTSQFGAFLDPVADKLMITGALLILLQLHRVDAAVALVIIGREIGISALREWMARIGRSAHLAVAFIGKLKTTSQMIAIPLLLYDDDDFLGLIPCAWLGTILINVAAVLTVVSMIYYVRRAFPRAENRP